MSSIHFKLWALVLENSYLQYTWTFHAKQQNYSDLREFSSKEVEDLLFEYSRNNPDIQECENPNKPNTIIIQKKLQERRRILRVAVDKNTNPWTVVTSSVGNDTGKTIAVEDGMIQSLAYEHMSSDYPIPEQLISEIKSVHFCCSLLLLFRLSDLNYLKIFKKRTNLKEQNDAKSKPSTDVNLSLWTNTNYEYYEDADILSIFFTKRSDVVRDICEHIDNYLIGYVPINKIISIEMFEASNLMYCHLFDFNGNMNNKPPLRLYSIYREDYDELSVYFTDTIPSITRLMKIEVEEDLILQVDDDMKLVAVIFCNASKRIARELSKEDSDRIREDLKLSFEILRASMRSRNNLLIPELM
ncbi:9296_t:CDS:2 [Funneliformis caledonium]|uniref:9296_t:CDS:1 n=1 Tax=Funneliformis caledonium TaxID=1117310 RepID=A0A9N8ZPY0_9GLOM|nr:9296_t:CDS:2 [Funneliformis caledonium]